MSAHTSTVADVVATFREAMREAGVPTPDEIVADGQLHRVQVEGDKPGSLNGWYVLYSDDPPAGAFGSWRTGVWKKWCSKASGTMTSAERGEFRRKVEETKRRLDEEQREQHAEARERAEREWANAAPAEPEHSYLQAKTVRAYGIRQDGDQLIVPVYGPDGTRRGLQRIAPDGTKLFQKGMEVRGGYLPIGKPGETMVICEGYATAATIHEITGHAVAVAFNCGNLKPVAQVLRNKLGADARIVIAADNDRDTDGNRGLTAATEAAQAVDGLLAVPVFEDDERGTDFNDLAVLRGSEAVEAAIVEAEGKVVPLRSIDGGRTESLRTVKAWIDEHKDGAGDPSKIQSHLARLDDLQYESIRSRLKAVTDWRIGMIDKLRENAHAGELSTKLQPEPPPDPIELYQVAREILEAEDQLAIFCDRVRAVGFAGSTDAVELLHLTYISRTLNRPGNVALTGLSAAGKTFTADTAAKFHPDDKIHNLTGMSERALAYSDRDFRHAVVIIGEAQAIHQDGIGASLIRQLSWSGEEGIKYDTVISTPEGPKPMRIEIPGPTGLVTTSTKPLDPEIATRMIEVVVTDSPEQTSAIVRKLAQRAATGDDDAEVDTADFVAASRWLEAAGERRVVVPFAPQVAEHVPTDDVRMRRDFEQVLTIVRVHAFAHQVTRPRDNAGRVVATEADYRAAHRLLSAVLAVALDDVTDAIRETVEAVEDLGGEVSYVELADHLSLAKSTIHSRGRRAIRAGYLANAESRKSYPAKLVIADPLPAPRTVLPDPADLDFDIPLPGTPRKSAEQPNESPEGGATAGVESVRVGVGASAESSERRTNPNDDPNDPAPKPGTGYSRSVRSSGSSERGGVEADTDAPDDDQDPNGTEPWSASI